jgi:hypothetical protein
MPALVWSCKNFDERTKFDVTYVNRVLFDSASTSMQSGIVHSDTLIMDFSDDLKDHDTRESQIEYVRMRLFSVEVDRIKTIDTGANMNFLGSVQFFQIAEEGEDLLVAKTEDVPLDVAYFEMGIIFDLDKDLKSLLTNDTSRYRVVYTTRSALGSPVYLKLAAKYEIDSRKFGI